jgi:acetyl-CoA C-acetyltransferase
MLAGQALGLRRPVPRQEGWRKRFGEVEVNQFVSAEKIASAGAAPATTCTPTPPRATGARWWRMDEGRFDREIVPLAGISADEGPRRDTTIAGMDKLQPVMPGGLHTAAAASQISSGAAAMLVASERAVREHGLVPRARVHHLSVLGDDPIWMLTAPIPATQRALKKAGMALGDIDLVEINEAFASVVLAWLKETGPTRPGSTSTAAPSPSATRWGPPGRG